jgi:hypothetical protein
MLQGLSIQSPKVASFNYQPVYLCQKEAETEENFQMFTLNKSAN